MAATANSLTKLETKLKTQRKRIETKKLAAYNSELDSPNKYIYKTLNSELEHTVIT